MKAEKLVEVLKVVLSINPKAMVACEHDRLWVTGEDEEPFLQAADKERLNELGAVHDPELGWYVWL